MKFEWFELGPVWGGDHPMWQLHMVSTDGGITHTKAILGTMTKLRNAWRIMERRPGSKPDFYWLDGDLSLEEAQRAAKLFLCVGRPT